MSHILATLRNLIFGRPRLPDPVPTVPVPLPSGPPVPTVPPAEPTASSLYAAINSARMVHGLSTLKLDPAICNVSAAWAAHLAMTGMLGHGDFPGRIATVAKGKAAGEDIGRGYPTAEAEVQGWLADEPHKRVLLGNWSTVGVGVGVGPDGRLVWVADFVLD